MSAECDVAIVGAGIAGLTAAMRLVRSGCDVIVLEARERVGGRARSVTLPGGAGIDLGATWCWPDEPLVQALIVATGIGGFPQSLTGDALFETDRDGVRRLDGNPIDVAATRFFGGAQQLAHQMARSLPTDVLRLGHPVDRLVLDDERVAVHAAQGVIAARHVVIAVPPALAASTIAFQPELPPRVHDVAKRTAVWMGGVVKAVAVYREAFWRRRQLAGAAISYRGPFTEVHDHSDAAGVSPALFGFAPAARFDNASAADIASEFTGQLARLFGPEAASPVSVHSCDWSKERYTSPAKPSPHATPSTYGAAEFHTPIAGRIHWASTETATRFAGHLEGAVHAGARCAIRIERASRLSL